MIELVRTDGGGTHPDPERLIKVLGVIASRFPYLIPKLRQLRDHKGTLVVTSSAPLTQAEQDLIALVWRHTFGEPLVAFHAESGDWDGFSHLAPSLPAPEDVDGYLRLLQSASSPEPQE